MRRSLLFLLLICSVVMAKGQSSCGNSDFELGSFTGWAGSYGVCCPININTPGFSTGKHTIMSGVGIDPYSLGKIPVVAPGGLFSARLGNDDAGAEAERLSYRVSVTAQNALFIYQYALVLEDPQHSVHQQPRFEVAMYDQFDSVVPCATYAVTAASNQPGFYDNGKIRLKEWSSVGIDLTNYIGQTVRIEFSVSDCGLGAHFGYAYLDCTCGAMNISSDFCDNASTVVLTAPAGFTYNWVTGQSTQAIVVNNPVQGMNYAVTLTSVTGCQTTLNHFLEPLKVSADFKHSGCSNDVSFTDRSGTGGGNIVGWNWDFGDGNFSTIQNPAHQYVLPGNYFVKLKVTSSIGCVDSIVKTVTVYNGPQAEFSNIVSCYYKPVVFLDSSNSDQGIISKWNWYYGDGSLNGNQQFPVHKYNNSGNFRVSLVIEDNAGCKDSVSKLIAVYDPPVADFTSPDVCHGNPVSFNNQSSTFNNRTLNYNWNFGDLSGSSILTNPAYTYNSPGIYAASLIVSADPWCTDTMSAKVVVAPIPKPDFTVDNPCEDQEAFFTDLSSVQFDTINSWTWDFGDGSHGSNTASPAHHYLLPAVYNVSLNVSTPYGCSKSLEKEITVYESPASAFIARPLTGCSPLNVHFSDLSTSKDGSLVTWNWKIDGVTNSNDKDFTKLFIQGGTYDISLKVISDKGCWDEKEKPENIQVFPQVKAEFSVEPSTKTNLAPFFYFVNHSSHSTDYIWMVDDSILSTEENFKWYSYAPGTYKITLIANNDWNCVDTVKTRLTIDKDFAFYIPNTFTPNGDGKNDRFYGSGVGIVETKMQIFNRWGAEIYNCVGKNCSWDGIQQDKSVLVSAGVYMYIIRVKDIFNDLHTFRGQVTLIQ